MVTARFVQQRLGVHLAGHTDPDTKVFVCERPRLYKAKHAANMSEPHATISAKSNASASPKHCWHLRRHMAIAHAKQTYKSCFRRTNSTRVSPRSGHATKQSRADFVDQTCCLDQRSFTSISQTRHIQARVLAWITKPTVMAAKKTDRGPFSGWEHGYITGEMVS